MAEFVEFRIEETIPEVEEMERLGLLSTKEVKKLIQKRRDFEYRLARRSKRKIDFINYINYEKKLIELIKIRRKQIGVYEKRQQIEASISRRVLKQARLLTRLWPSHLDTWALRINFAHFIGWKEEISGAYTEQVHFHGNSESVWIAWAKWEIEERRNFDKARVILLSKAPLYHPKSHLIKRELFRLELLYVEMLMNKVKHENIAGLEEVIEENRQKVLNCAVAQAVFLDAVRTLPKPEVYLELYQVAEKFKFAHKLREEIYRDLCMKFPGSECLWKLKAQRLVSGLVEAETALFNSNSSNENMETEEGEAHKDSASSIGTESKNHAKEVNHEETDKNEESSDDEMNLDGVKDEEKEEKEEEDEESEEEEEEEVDTEEDVDEELDGEDEEVEEEEDESNDEEEDDSDVEEGKGKEKSTAIEEEDDVGGEKAVKSKGTPEESETSLTSSKLILPPSSGKLEPKAKLELVISVFDEALKVVGDKFVNTYIDELLPLLYQCWGVADMAGLIYKNLLKIFEHHTALLSPFHFYIWYQVVCQQQEEGSSQQARAVLEHGVRQHPSASHLKLELVQYIVREADTDAQIMKEFRKISSSMQGECGLTAWREFVKHLCKDNNKIKVFKAAVDHEDLRVAQGMRVLYLQDVGLQEGIASARKLYQTLKWRPPFCGRLQALMVELELAQDMVNAEAVREVFGVSLQQHGSTNPGLWLAYIQFEKKHGDPLKAGGLYTRAEKELQPQQALFFRELILTVQEMLGKEKTPSGCESNKNSYFVENTEEEESQSKEDGQPRPALAPIFEEELTLSYTANIARSSFFSAIHSMEKNIKKGKKSMTGEEGREWEKVLELLLGQKITLRIKEVKVETVDIGKNNNPHQEKLIKPRFKDKYEPTDHLNPEEKNPKTIRDDDIEKILATSEVLKPDFMQKTSLSPYFVSKKKAKALRKKESVKTKGPGWFNMKAPELTEEAKRDLEVLQMRSVLDPKRHYKNDMKVLPKYFQLAEVVDSPVDFYSSRVPKKQRKRTMAEEIMHDEETLRYQKRKYTEIIAAKQKKQFKHPNVLRKKKTKKSAAKN